MNETPERYKPDPRSWEQKDWLYEQYWGQLKSGRAIAEDVEVHERTIREELARHGIPRRPVAWRKESQKSPFAGFYNGGENAQVSGTEVNTAAFDPEKANEEELDWNNATRQSSD
jgi:hypothetical protein